MNKLKNKLTKLFSMILVSIFALGNIVSYADEEKNIESGIYKLKNEVKHDSDIGVSMARTYTSETMDLEYTKEKIIYKVTFTGTDYMENYRILVNGKEVKTEVIEKNDESNSIKLSFEVSNIEDKIVAKIYVDAMGRDVEFEIDPLIDTLTLVEKIEEPEKEKEVNNTKETKETKEVVDSENNNRNISSYLPIAIGGLVVLIILFAIRKRK